LGLLQLVYLTVAHLQSRLVLGFDRTSLLGVAGSIAAQVLLGLAIDVGVRSRALQLALGGGALFINVLAGAYLLATHSSFDPNLLLATWALAFSPESLAIIAGTFDDSVTIAFLATGAAIGTWLLLSPPASVYGAASRRTALVSCAVALSLMFAPIPRGYNDFASVVACGVTSAWAEDDASTHLDSGFPLVRVTEKREHALQKSPANVPVVLLMIESFNARFIEKKSGGQSVTPTFNELLKQGVYVEKFYGNSIQTSRGQFATLYGLPPVSRGSIFSRQQKTQLHGLPQVLKEHGYLTAFLQAYRDVEFEGTHAFLSNHGFEYVEAPFRQREEDGPFVWGWGPEDRLFYRDAFQRVDELSAQHDKKLFITLATISSHMRFRVPEQRRQLFPAPTNAEQRYVNALHLADADLAAFMREIRSRSYLNDAVIVITGDHSFPTGRHGIEFNESGIFEESFRTPLLILWPDHLPPARMTALEASQIDIPPTLLDLLNLPCTQSHFLGQSIFSREARNPVPLYQPFNGEYWGAVKNGEKLMVRRKTGERVAFFIPANADDERVTPPGELKAVSELDAAINSLGVVRRALERDRVWPAEQPRD
jgi:arylsulfatase A-like enzyme